MVNKLRISSALNFKYGIFYFKLLIKKEKIQVFWLLNLNIFLLYIFKLYRALRLNEVNID